MWKEYIIWWCLLRHCRMLPPETWVISAGFCPLLMATNKPHNSVVQPPPSWPCIEHTKALPVLPVLGGFQAVTWNDGTRSGTTLFLPPPSVPIVKEDNNALESNFRSWKQSGIGEQNPEFGTARFSARKKMAEGKYGGNYVIYKWRC